MPADPKPRTGTTSAALPHGLRHDLLNALNAVIGYATLLRMELPAGQGKIWADRLHQAAEEAQVLAERIPSDRLPTPGGRVLLVAEGDAGDGIELALDRQGWDIIRALGWAEAASLLAEASGDVDVVLAGEDAPPADGGQLPVPLVRFAVEEPSAVIAERLRRALDGSPEQD